MSITNGRTIGLALAVLVIAAGCIRADFEDGIHDCFNEQEAADDRLAVAPNPQGEGNVLRVEVRPGDVAIRADIGTGKTRAELQQTRPCGDRYPVGSQVFYGWKILIPADYPNDGTNAFQIVGQFHHRSTGSPQIALHLGLDDGQPVYRIMWREQLDDAATQIGVVPFTPGEWTQLAFRVVWSPDPAAGQLEVRADGADVLGGTFRGATAYDEQPKVLKLGLYRGPGYNTTNVLYYDDVTIGASWSAVGG